MSFDTSKIVVGIAKVYINGVLVGYTTEDGVSWEPSSQDTVKVKAAEALGTIANYRSGVERQLMFSLLQIDADQLKWALGLDPSTTITTGSGTKSIPVKYSTELPTLNVMFVVDTGPNGRTITYETTAQPVEAGSLEFKKTDPTALEVTLEELMDVTTNTFGTFTFTDASGTALALDVTTPFDPADEDTDVAVDTTIEVKFNQAVAYHSLNNGNFMLFSVAAGNELTPVSCTYAFKASGSSYDHTTVVITPASNLSASTTYLVIVGANVQSVTGKKLGTNTEAEFATAA